MERPTTSSRLELGVFAVALVALVTTAGSGPGWDLASGHAAIAGQLERTSAAPLYGLLANLAAQLPAGEVGFRLGILGAVLGALTLAGVVAAARAVLPTDPLAGVIGALLLAIAPPFRDAAAFATPSLLAACGIVWAFAGAAAHAREPGVRQLTIALVGSAAVIGSAPWLGAALTVATIAWLDRATAKREHLAIGTGAIGVAMITWWLGSLGALPDPDPSLTAMVAESGRGSAAIVMGTGLLGAAFGAATGLAPARVLLLWIVIAVAHAIAIDHRPEPLLGILAVGCAIVPSAIARVMPEKRALVVLLAGIPLVGIAVATGAAISVDDPEDAPARLAADLLGAMPPGPGVIVMTSSTAWAAVSYAQIVTGARPDLALLPPLPVTASDGAVADALRAKQIAVSDVPAFGRLDPTRALARGRGFELRADQPEPIEFPSPPATYSSALGERAAVTLAITRGRYEAAHGRLDAAARATGLTSRFGAAELAMLATTAPSRDRPALFAFLPRLDDPPTDRWRLDLFGDDLAWVAGIDQPLVASPPSRKLHGLWRELLAGKRTADDSEIIALGPSAVAATRELVAAVRTPPAAPSR